MVNYTYKMNTQMSQVMFFLDPTRMIMLVRNAWRDISTKNLSREFKIVPKQSSILKY